MRWKVSIRNFSKPFPLPQYNEKETKMTKKQTFESQYGGVFATQAERDAWDAFREARIEAALQSPLLSKEDANKAFDAMLARLRNVSHSVA